LMGDILAGKKDLPMIWLLSLIKVTSTLAVSLIAVCTRKLITEYTRKQLE
jgi:hypothetical protein